MPKYFLHLRESGSELLDPEGVEFEDVIELKANVLAAARQLLAAELLTGRVTLDQRIDAEDTDGRLVHTLSFCDAFSLFATERGAWHFA